MFLDISTALTCLISKLREVRSLEIKESQKSKVSSIRIPEFQLLFSIQVFYNELPFFGRITKQIKLLKVES